MTLADVDPAVLADLRNLGYDLSTFDEAVEAARRCYGVDDTGARHLLTGDGDLVDEPADS